MKPYFQEENITIYNGDCLDVMKEFPDKYFNFCLTDPPYGVDIKYLDYDDSEENWFSLMKEFIPEAIRISNMVIFPNARIKRMKFFYDNFEPDWWIVWDKGSPGIRSPIGFNDYELLAVYGKNNPTAMHDIVRVTPDEKMGNYGHPCPKPLRWAKWLITRATKENDLVVDPFLGSGTTARACKDLGRKCIGIEISKDYCDIAIDRLRQEVLF